VPILKASGIRKIRLHDLRHTFGSLLIQNGPRSCSPKSRWDTARFRSL
jgi:integrase